MKGKTCLTTAKCAAFGLCWTSSSQLKDRYGIQSRISPATSVVDPFCRVHSHDNLLIADGSPQVTNASFNPAETIMALAWRRAENIVNNW